MKRLLIFFTVFILVGGCEETRPPGEPLSETLQGDWTVYALHFTYGQPGYQKQAIGTLTLTSHEYRFSPAIDPIPYHLDERLPFIKTPTGHITCNPSSDDYAIASCQFGSDWEFFYLRVDESIYRFVGGKSEIGFWAVEKSK